jgi:hypothetical protein
VSVPFSQPECSTELRRRTMISEITKEKRYQSRAFLILPMSFNVAGIVGPGKTYKRA